MNCTPLSPITTTSHTCSQTESYWVGFKHLTGFIQYLLKSIHISGFSGPFKDGASFCYCTYVLRISGYSGFLRNLPLKQQYFYAAYDCAEKADLSKGYQNPKRKLAVTTHFSVIIELKFGKKFSYILCILTLF